jgi:type IV fimbrial biogenesis protein FimT
MYSNRCKPGCTFKNGTPFICRFIPFIGLNAADISPSVGENIPTVGFRGFTLTELIITLTIAGILMAIAVPGMGNFIKNHRLSGQANDLLADLAFARSEAIKRGATVTVCKQDATNANPTCETTNAAPWTPGWVIFIDSTSPSPNANNQVDAGETVLRTHAALEGGNFATAANTAAAGSLFDNAAILIRFRNNGTTIIDPATAAGMARIRLCDNRGNKNALTVELAPAGRARVNSTPPTLPATCPTTSNWT